MRKTFDEIIATYSAWIKFGFSFANYERPQFPSKSVATLDEIAHHSQLIVSIEANCEKDFERHRELGLTYTHKCGELINNHYIPFDQRIEHNGHWFILMKPTGRGNDGVLKWGVLGDDYGYKPVQLHLYPNRK